MDHGRRNVITALGVAAPLGLLGRAWASPEPAVAAPELRFRSFEESVREAFQAGNPDVGHEPFPCRRVEVGDCNLLRHGVQGCHNDRPFAGFPAGHLRIVRAGSEPGPAIGGVRLYVATVDIAFTGGRTHGHPSRPLDFAALPPAAQLAAG